MPRRLAVVDMGSNTLKFSVTEVEDSGAERILHSHAETVRLGAVVAITGALEPNRIERALLALRHYEIVARSYAVEACIGVATAALRTATNGDDLLEEIHRTTGWSVRVISGDEEARLAFVGLASSLPDEQDSLLVDIGGGSTELIHVSGGAVSASESLDMGSGSLADRCFQSDPPGVTAVSDALVHAGDALTGSTVLPQVTSPVLVFSGGNGQFLKAFAEWTDIAIPFEPGRFRELLSTMADVHSTRLAGYLNIVPERARMLPAGGAIAMAVINRTSPRSIQAAPSGIRGGLVANWLAAQP
ncbi:MAG: hypothetical protein WKF63_10170 [Thermomicrobiales bacterium]